MSRIGKQPVIVPKDVTVSLVGDAITVKSSKGEMVFQIPESVSIVQADGVLTVSRKRNDTATRSLHGFVRAHVANIVTGLTKGWTKTLELSGVGYRATMSGANLSLSLGFSHPVTVTPPSGITFTVTEGKIIVSGTDKQLVGQEAANIRALKKPEPYKGKGIKYQGEVIRKKAGKAAKAVGGAGGAK